MASGTPQSCLQMSSVTARDPGSYEIGPFGLRLKTAIAEFSDLATASNATRLLPLPPPVSDSIYAAVGGILPTD